MDGGQKDALLRRANNEKKYFMKNVKTKTRIVNS